MKKYGMFKMISLVLCAILLVGCAVVSARQFDGPLLIEQNVVTTTVLDGSLLYDAVDFEIWHMEGEAVLDIIFSEERLGAAPKSLEKIYIPTDIPEDYYQTAGYIDKTGTMCQWSVLTDDGRKNIGYSQKLLSHDNRLLYDQLIETAKTEVWEMGDKEVLCTYYGLTALMTDREYMFYFDFPDCFSLEEKKTLVKSVALDMDSPLIGKEDQEKYSYNGTHLCYIADTVIEVHGLYHQPPLGEIVNQIPNLELKCTNHTEARTYEVMLADVEIPMLTYTCENYYSAEFGTQGVYLDFTDYLPKMPNASAALEGVDLSDYREKDGGLYRLPVPGTDGAWMVSKLLELEDIENVLRFVDFLYFNEEAIVTE